MVNSPASAQLDLKVNDVKSFQSFPQLHRDQQRLVQSYQQQRQQQNLKTIRTIQMQKEAMTIKLKATRSQYLSKRLIMRLKLNSIYFAYQNHKRIFKFIFLFISTMNHNLIYNLFIMVKCTCFYELSDLIQEKVGKCCEKQRRFGFDFHFGRLSISSSTILTSSSPSGGLFCLTPDLAASCFA